ncbi:hypothetical protein A3B85_02980 [Candidatus Nomurabacteria bacterium RIFCSPHIGHO2_02_FULL_37_13]|uniref:Thioredoxin domain-containing protein n=1 Tax=Candidatus Nomurabacteria bacterium RIFCSPHIGHO2_02_FULL_37_13 TaxID=1801750 RepID=A0A1F6W5M1_9BACT|nr:MAG: hypothetical protein A2640_01445 [Candidatus Nomurabacteria bacterium RIFCSPHIGHO2_01_FULL_36_23]OGI77191.1 MAG: hypothetical protein A3B85_02980 [Candidatus Nomurabacteria bacterium RIFCSPHIGHO2_02_FULL_37_13]OGI87731.1 MAG: hypothetical protein A2906_02715 [Candidatus Nomurabacteria bacterium RIFCSPLOWO2_01_FULL_37_25]
MEENQTENKLENNGQNNESNSAKQIAGAILVAGILIAGAVLLKGNTLPTPGNIITGNNGTLVTAPAKVVAEDRTLGNTNAKVALVMYEDFQCPFCEKFVKESEQTIRDTYVKNGSVQLVYRDFAFLGPESIRAAEAARCAGDQNKFWEYHDYLYTHQNGENQGNFSDAYLKDFAKILGLNTTSFNQCLSEDKYMQAVVNSTNEGKQAGVTGTPKGFIIKDGKVFTTIDGAEPLNTIIQKLDAATRQY